MREIAIGEHRVKVDDSDYDVVSKWKWCLNKGKYNRTYYAVRGIREGDKVVRVYMHRFVCQAKKGDTVTWANGDTLDVRKENLRKNGKCVNMLNRLSVGSTKSKYKGVYYYAATGRWTANYSKESLGYYGTEDEAAIAYNTAVYAAMSTEGYVGGHMNRIEGKALIGRIRDKKHRKSLYRGVRQKSKGCWEASIQFAGKRHHLGFHGTEGAAGQAFNDKCDDLGCVERKNEIVVSDKTNGNCCT